MRAIVFLFLLFIMKFTSGQDLDNKNLQSLIETELAFARMAREQNTRDAFLRYLSDKTVMFLNSQISRGKKVWEERKPDSTLIIWEPVFADISASGDFGYTTGPSQYYASRKPGEQAYDGAYITVWSKQAGGDWKMAIDIGVYPQPRPATKSLTTSTLNAVSPRQKRKDFKPALIKQEKSLINALAGKRGKYYETYVASESRFYRAGIEPVTAGEKIRQLVNREAGMIEYTLVDSDSSSAGDLGYTYGKAKIRDRDKVIDGFYLRIYKKVNGDWKIVLDAIHQ